MDDRKALDPRKTISDVFKDDYPKPGRIRVTINALKKPQGKFSTTIQCLMLIQLSSPR